MANVVGSLFWREVFTASDGRILGKTIRVDTWFHPFEGRTTETSTTVETAAFRTMAEAGVWVDELRRAESVVRCQLRGGTRLVFCT